MITVLESIFPTLQDFREFAPGVSSDIEMKELNSSAISAKKRIMNVITKDIWASVTEQGSSDAYSHLRMAMANLTMHQHLIFDIISKRVSGGGEVYKSELEKMLHSYIDNYYNAMDSLLQELETSEDFKEAWLQTPGYADISELKISTAALFDSFYAIDTSYLFFFRTIHIQKEVLDDVIGSYFERIKEVERPELERKLLRALAQFVVSIAVIRFDIIELPATIRSLFDEQKSSRSGLDEHSRMKELSADLHKSALNILQGVDLILNQPESGSIDTETSFNKPDDKIFLLS